MSNWVFDEDGEYWFYWPMCSMASCPHRICFGLSDKYCYPHSTDGQSFEVMMDRLRETPAFDMTNVYRQIRSRPEGLKPVQTFTEGGNG